MNQESEECCGCSCDRVLWFQERAEQELGKLRKTISQKEAELEKIRPQYDEMKRKEEECTRELSLKEQKRKELYAKQGRGSQFTSKDQRDQWIQKELRSGAALVMARKITISCTRSCGNKFKLLSEHGC